MASSAEETKQESAHIVHIAGAGGRVINWGEGDAVKTVIDWLTNHEEITHIRWDGDALNEYNFTGIFKRIIEIPERKFVFEKVKWEDGTVLPENVITKINNMRPKYVLLAIGGIGNTINKQGLDTVVTVLNLGGGPVVLATQDYFENVDIVEFININIEKFETEKPKGLGSYTISDLGQINENGSPKNIDVEVVFDETVGNDMVKKLLYQDREQLLIQSRMQEQERRKLRRERHRQLEQKMRSHQDESDNDCPCKECKNAWAELTADMVYRGGRKTRRKKNKRKKTNKKRRKKTNKKRRKKTNKKRRKKR